MFCDECHKKIASVFITQMENDNVVKKRLCEDCARQLMMPGGAFEFLAMIPQIVSGPLELGLDSLEIEDLRNEILACSRCGTTLSDLKETGRMGCPECYEAFAEPLGGMFRELQYGDLHVGKVPNRCSDSVQMRRRLADLRNRLRELVEREDFEVAAEVRDEIKSLETQLAGAEGDGHHGQGQP